MRTEDVCIHFDLRPECPRDLDATSPMVPEQSDTDVSGLRIGIRDASWSQGLGLECLDRWRLTTHSETQRYRPLRASCQSNLRQILKKTTILGICLLSAAARGQAPPPAPSQRPAVASAGVSSATQAEATGAAPREPGVAAPSQTQKATVSVQTDPSACIAAHADGQVLRAQGKLIAALEKFRSCAHADCPEVIRSDCSEFGSVVARSMPTLRLHARDPEGHPITAVQVELDGVLLGQELSAQLIAVDPGEHRFRFRAANQQVVDVVVRVQIAEHDRTVVADFPLEQRHSRAWPVVTYALAGVGISGVASFIGFGLAGRSIERDLDKCAPYCTDHEAADRMRSHYLVADISLGVGLASLGAAAYLYFARPDLTSSSARTSAFSLDVRATGDGAAMVTAGRF